MVMIVHNNSKDNDDALDENQHKTTLITNKIDHPGDEDNLNDDANYDGQAPVHAFTD